MNGLYDFLLRAKERFEKVSNCPSKVDSASITKLLKKSKKVIVLSSYNMGGVCKLELAFPNEKTKKFVVYIARDGSCVDDGGQFATRHMLDRAKEEIKILPGCENFAIDEFMFLCCKFSEIPAAARAEIVMALASFMKENGVYKFNDKKMPD
jgi:hypothetical protein